jgi:hypothetical protein
MIDDQRLAEIFRYHAPHDGQAEQYEMIRDYGLYFAEHINRVCPDGHDKSVAIDKLREAVMWANASIACGQIPHTGSDIFRASGPKPFPPAPITPPNGHEKINGLSYSRHD